MKRIENGNTSSRARLAKLLTLKQDTERFEHTWRGLERRKLIKDWEEGGYPTEDLVGDARLLLEDFDDMEGRSSSTGRRAEPREAAQMIQDVPVELTGRERVAADALRVYLAAHAARRPLVKRFRRDNLPGGKLLTQDKDISEYLAAELGVEPDVDWYLEAGGGKEHTVFPFKLDAERPTDEELTGQQFLTDDDVARFVAEEDERREKDMEAVWGGYMGSHFEMLGEWLAQKYPWENVRDAEVFLISGRPPRLAETLSATVSVSNMTNSITFLPWVSKETMLKAYHNIQTFRLPEEKTLRVLRFVCEQMDQEGRPPSWDELLHRWNAANPDEGFRDRGAIHKAHSRAVKALVPPYLPLRLGL